jgi:hypothetical protein
MIALTGGIGGGLGGMVLVPIQMVDTMVVVMVVVGGIVSEDIVILQEQHDQYIEAMMDHADYLEWLVKHVCVLVAAEHLLQQVHEVVVCLLAVVLVVVHVEVAVAAEDKLEEYF